jgi:hypothetical protein
VSKRTEEERTNARNVLLNAMAAEMAAGKRSRASPQRKAPLGAGLRSWRERLDSFASSASFK